MAGGGGRPKQWATKQSQLALGSRGGRSRRAALAAEPPIRALLGQRLVVPCSGSPTANQHHQQATGGNQTLASGSEPPLALGRRRPLTGKLRGKSVANGQGISLIVWHKDDQLSSPIFTVDARGAPSLREAKQQTSADSIKGRAHLEESTRLDSRGLGATPALVIDETNPADAGLYTCTVEFHKAPTQTHQVQVELVGE